MTTRKQLRQGFLATLLVAGSALLLCYTLPPAFLSGWATLFLVALVPSQMILSLVWGGAYPGALARLPQPWRGLGFSLLTALCGGVIGTLAWQTVGGGQAEPTPFVIMYLIFTVPVAMTLIIPFQTWPLRLLGNHPLALGAALLVATYGGGYLLFRALFDFAFLADAPFYRAALDPHGAFMAWQPLVLSIAAVVPMLVLVLLDFWPLTALSQRLPVLGRQPWLGLTAGGLIAAGAALLWWLFVSRGGMDLVAFLTNICVATNFGLFTVLVLFETLPALALPQPWRGLQLTGGGVALAAILFFFYRLAAVNLGLGNGQPPYERELWLASAMLAVTFPAMVAFASYFGFWPLRRA